MYGPCIKSKRDPSWEQCSHAPYTFQALAITGIVICAAICVAVFINQGDIYDIIHQVSWGMAI